MCPKSWLKTHWIFTWVFIFGSLFACNRGLQDFEYEEILHSIPLKRFKKSNIGVRDVNVELEFNQWLTCKTTLEIQTLDFLKYPYKSPWDPKKRKQKGHWVFYWNIKNPTLKVKREVLTNFLFSFWKYTFVSDKCRKIRL